MPNLTTLVYYLTPLLLLVASAVCIFILQRQKIRLRREGISWLQTYRLLISHIQRHRGLTTSYLSGQWNFSEKITELEKQISRDIEHISKGNEAVKGSALWVGITQHWAKLARAYESLNIDNNIHQHTCLIRSILSFVDEMSAKHYLTNLSSKNLNWSEVLTLAELLGQARALGTVITSLISAGENPMQNKRQLNRVVQEIASIRERSGTLSQDNSLHFIDLFVSELNQLIDADSASISPQEYFNQASSVIEKVYDYLDDDLKYVADSLSSN